MFGRWRKAKKERTASKSIVRRIRALFTTEGSENFYSALEDLLISADFGALTAREVVEELRETGKAAAEDREHVIDRLKGILRPSLRVVSLDPEPRKRSLYLVFGVNGVGKTTTIAKMAHRFSQAGEVVLAAGDTFRAAAIDQLAVHAHRVGARIVKQVPGSDPGAVLYDAITSARSCGENIVIADSAGRMHNRDNLVKELVKMDRIARSRLDEEDRYWKILVIDATTGQNGIRQAESFDEAVGVDAVVLTKYDSSAKGGLAAAIGRRLSLPVAYLGVGEGMDQLIPFDAEAYLSELLAGD